jgi:hypothetical protein
MPAEATHVRRISTRKGAPSRCRISDYINQLAAISTNELSAIETSHGKYAHDRVSPMPSYLGEPSGLGPQLATVARVPRRAAQYLANVRNHPDSAVTHSTSPMRAAVRAISNQGIQLDLVGGDRETPANSEGIDPAIVEEANDVMKRRRSR